MSKTLIIGAVLAISAALVLGDALIEVPKSGAYTVTHVQIDKARTYAQDLGWDKEHEQLLIEMLTKDFGVRFENIGHNHFNITFYSHAKVSNMEIEDGKELDSPNIVGMPVKNKLTMEPLKLNIRQTYPSGKHADLSWTFKPNQMTITHTSNSHSAEIKLKKNDAFQG
ncbi:unnamed protein product [Orchesella dallaii]|uniref:Uncharacterized protein n=1 Tax=Orchesella dallaii TaxID=48710 RepID=A0ABP1PZN4_9HEXA